jgi:hypothetical protein
MADEEPVRGEPDFGATPSPPRAGRGWRLVVYVLLLVLACGAIWFIDRGAMMTNGGMK